jgi:uncharacterized membrane protein YgdD (TMEM256/DUF423 family)
MGSASRPFAAIGAWLGLVAVAAGAFGAHALRSRVDPVHLQAFETGVRYQILHALALLAVGLAEDRGRERLLQWAGILFVLGVALFSGSLYGLALNGPRWLGPVTPLGGLALMAAWACLAVALTRPRSTA